MLRPITRFLLVLLLLPATTWAVPDTLTIRFEAGQNIRELAGKHLANPDLWPDILYANGLQAVHQIQPGMHLKIPVKVILAVENTLGTAKQIIQTATSKGARVMAAKTIGAAIQHQADALNQRRTGAWDQALAEARRAVEQARLALAETERQRNQPLEALLEEARGTVERRPPGAWGWRGASKNTVLVEQERLRTLSNSHAAVRFRDNSRLQLNANAQLLIQQMRQDNLNQRKQTGVVLQGGDIYALLGGNSRQREFEVTLPGVETQIDSNNFWADQSDNTARFANYDSGKLAVSSGGQEVILQQNQGTTVKSGGVPAAPKTLLPPPVGLDPPDYAVFYRHHIPLRWQATAGAKHYWLEIARDNRFEDLWINEPAVAKPEFLLALPDNGLYYWRLSSVDADNLPGGKSKARFFKVQRDDTPPFLMLTQPAPGEMTRAPEVHVQGETEAKARVALNDQPVEVSVDGGFSLTWPLQAGNNVLRLQAMDAAGNQTALRRDVVYLTADSVPIAFDEHLPRLGERHFAINQDRFTLKGRALPLAALRIQGPNGFAGQVAADDDGAFQINLPLSEPTQTFHITASLPSGVTSEKQVVIDRDGVPPAIHLDPPLPKRVNRPAQPLAGRVEQAQILLVNGVETPLAEAGEFASTLNLIEGDNEVIVEARDVAGNRQILRRQIVLDTRPPTLTNHEAQPKQAKGGDTVNLALRASDASGLKAGARYKLAIGGREFSGYLRLCPGGGCYQGQLRVPAEVQGNIQWREATLEDYAGNRKTFAFP